MRLMFIVFIALLAGCSSNLKKGDNMMESEQYDEAVHYYEKAWADDPGDEEVAQKLYEARTRMVYAHLIKVRLQRQGKQPRAAATLLNKTLKNIKRWKIIADSGVKATIEEEVMEAGFWLDKELKRLGLERNYNQFFYYLSAFDEIQQSGLADASRDQYYSAMRDLGQSQCRAMKSQLTPQSHFLYDTWIAYCGVFGIQGAYRIAADKSRYKSLNVSANGVKVSRSASIKKSAIADRIERQLQDHLWFSSQGNKPLTLALTGNIFYQKSVKSKTFSRIYKDKEETFELIKDPKNPDKVIRKLLISKPVKKTVKFKGKAITEKTSHSLQLLGRINGKKLSASESTAVKTHETQSHSTYFKSEKIRPLNPTYFNQTAWMNGMGKTIVNQAIKRLDTLWREAYCQNKGTQSQLAKDEYPARCAALEPTHATVGAWTQAQFDLSYEQLQVLLKR